MRDLVVAGGGPVGLATALHAARAGLDVAVREPRSGIIDKACGEGLMPGAVAALAELGLRPDGHRIDGIRYLDARRHVDATFRHGPGLGVRRTALHACLLDAARDAGVVVDQRPVAVVTQDDMKVMVDDEAARYLIAADGLHSPVRRLLGIERPVRGRRRFGQRCHVATAPWSSYVEVHWSRDAEAYVTPVAADQVGVAVLSSSRAPYSALLATFPALTERLQGLEQTRVRGAGPLRQRASRRVVGRVLLVGDAAGYVDALTGEGLAAGLAQARAAVEAVARGTVGDYERTWRRLTWRHDLLTLGLLTATRPVPVRGLVVPAAARLPRTFAAAVNQLARPA